MNPLTSAQAYGRIHMCSPVVIHVTPVTHTHHVIFIIDVKC